VVRKLTDEEVMEIRIDARGGATHRELGRMYELSRRAVGRVVRGDRYGDVSSDNPDTKPYKRSQSQIKRKLTYKQAQEIRALYAAYKANARDVEELKKKNPNNQLTLAYEYGVTQLTICKIVNNQSYRTPDQGPEEEKKIANEDEELKNQIRALLTEKPSISKRAISEELGLSRRRTKRLREEIEEDTE